MNSVENPQIAIPPDIRTASRIWAKIGFLSFGGPAAQIAMMHRMVVEENRWLTERQFLDALNFCMLLPGPEAMQLATYSGWRMHGVVGGLVAGLLFVLPGAVTILLLAGLYANYGSVPIVEAAFAGIKAAVLVIVLEALMKVSRRALTGGSHYVVALMAFASLFLLKLPYPLIVIAAAVYGFAAGNRPAESTAQAIMHDRVPVPAGGFLKTVCFWLTIWWAPVLFLYAAGAQTILIEISVFFSKLAVVTFGGAYAVLSYMAQDVVTAKNWLDAREMIDGLGLAETTPGPLILVTEFVGFLAAEKAGGFWLGLMGALVTLWVTFVPCFLWIFAGAPYIECLSMQPRLKGALTAITAAVVGVILNLALWFALNVAFADLGTLEIGLVYLPVPDWASLDWRILAIALLSAILLLRLKWSVPVTLAICAAAGILLEQFLF